MSAILDTSVTEALLQRVAASLGDGSVISGPEVAERNTGFFARHPIQATGIVRPRSTADVATLLRECHAVGQPVVAHGGRTGLVEAQSTRPGEIVVSMERMNAIESVDVKGRTMTVQAGVPLQQVQEAAADAGLFYPVDLGARGSCAIGGNIATNAGGNRVLRWGMTRENVLGLEVVLADGTVLSSLAGMIKNNAGYDLKHLFIGSEGTLGIVTRATLRLRAAPISQETAMVAFEDFASVLAFLAFADARLGGTLSAFELMWQNFYELVTTPPAQQQPPLAPGYPYYVLVEAMGGDQAADHARMEALLGDALEAGHIVDAVLAMNGSQRENMWAMRDDVGQTGRHGPTIAFDVSLPLPLMPDYVEEVNARLSQAFETVHNITLGHIADGNLHFVVAAGDRSAQTRHAVETCVYEPLRPRGGSVSAEHGVGLEKLPWLSVTRSPAEIATMRAIKAALDPQCILNPGKIFPRDADA